MKGRIWTIALLGLLLPLALATAARAVTYAYIPSYDDDRVVRVRTSDAAVGALDISAALPAGAICSPHGAAVMPDGSFVLVTCEAHDAVLRITDGDFLSGAAYARAPIAVGRAPLGVAIAPNGDYAYVANYDDDTVTKISLSTFQVLGQPLEVGDGPWGVTAIYDDLSEEIQVYVANYAAGSVTVIRDSAADGITTETIPNVAGGVLSGGPTGIAATPDGRFVYVANQSAANVAIIQTSDRSVVKRIGIAGVPWGVAVGSQGDYVYVSNNDRSVVTVIDTNQQTVHTTFPVGARQLGVAAPRNGDYAYVVNEESDDTIRKIDLTAETVETVVSGETSGAIALGGFIGGRPPNPPSDLSGRASSYDHIDLTWTDNSSDELGFRLQRRIGTSGDFVQIAQLPAGTTDFRDTGLASETRYAYRLCAFNEASDSAYVSTSAEIDTPEGGFAWCFIGALLDTFR